MDEVRGGNGEGPSVGLKVVLTNRATTHEGKAGLASGCVQDQSRVIVKFWKSTLWSF